MDVWPDPNPRIGKIKNIAIYCKSEFFTALNSFKYSPTQRGSLQTIHINDKLKKYWTNMCAECLYLFLINTHHTILRPFKQLPQRPTNPKDNRLRTCIRVQQLLFPTLSRETAGPPYALPPSASLGAQGLRRGGRPVSQAAPLPKSAGTSVGTASSRAPRLLSRLRVSKELTTPGGSFYTPKDLATLLILNTKLIFFSATASSSHQNPRSALHRDLHRGPAREYTTARGQEPGIFCSAPGASIQ